MLFRSYLPSIPAIAAIREGPKERVGLIEHPSIGSRNRCATMTLIAIGKTPNAPPPTTGISIVANTVYTATGIVETGISNRFNINLAKLSTYHKYNAKIPSSIVPSISAKKTCPPENTPSSQELEPKALAAGQCLPKIMRRNTAPAMEPSICQSV